MLSLALCPISPVHLLKRTGMLARQHQDTICANATVRNLLSLILRQVPSRACSSAAPAPMTCVPFPLQRPRRRLIPMFPPLMQTSRLMRQLRDFVLTHAVAHSAVLPRSLSAGFLRRTSCLDLGLVALAATTTGTTCTHPHFTRNIVAFQQVPSILAPRPPNVMPQSRSHSYPFRSIDWCNSR